MATDTFQIDEFDKRMRTALEALLGEPVTVAGAGGAAAPSATGAPPSGSSGGDAVRPPAAAPRAPAP